MEHSRALNLICHVERALTKRFFALFFAHNKEEVLLQQKKKSQRSSIFPKNRDEMMDRPTRRGRESEIFFEGMGYPPLPSREIILA